MSDCLLDEWTTAGAVRCAVHLPGMTIDPGTVPARGLAAIVAAVSALRAAAKDVDISAVLELVPPTDKLAVCVAWTDYDIGNPAMVDATDYSAYVADLWYRETRAVLLSAALACDQRDYGAIREQIDVVVRRLR